MITSVTENVVRPDCSHPNVLYFLPPVTSQFYLKSVPFLKSMINKYQCILKLNNVSDAILRISCTDKLLK